MGYRFRVWFKTPQPGKMTLFPAPEKGANKSILAEVLFFPSLFKGDRVLWFFSWIFHITLALVFFGHVRVVTGLIDRMLFGMGVSAAGVDRMSAVVGGAAGVVMLATGLVLFIRRISTARVREISSFSDFFALLLLLAIITTGDLMRFGARFDLELTMAAENAQAQRMIKVAEQSAAKSPAAERKAVVSAITAIDKGPKVLKLYMENCAKCGTCATVCPVYYGKQDPKYNPARRSDIIRAIYKKRCTTAGKVFGGLVGARDYEDGELKSWVDHFYSCTGCRRCATYCPPSGDVLVNIEATMGIAKVFHVLGMADKWTMSSSCFDGANYGLFTGNDAHMKEDNKAYVEEAKRLGAKYMFMGECGHAYRIMKMMMEAGKWWGDLPFEVINCMDWTAEHIKAGRLQFDKSRNPQPVTYHDPCNFGRSCGITETPRIILKASCADFREMTPNRGQNWCCGGGAGLSAMDDLHAFRMTVSGRKKLEQIRATGAKYVAAACSNCKRQLTQLMEYHKEDIAVGGVHDMLSRALLIDGKAAVRQEI